MYELIQSRRSVPQLYEEKLLVVDLRPRATFGLIILTVPSDSLSGVDRDCSFGI